MDALNPTDMFWYFAMAAFAVIYYLTRKDNDDGGTNSK